jgi:Fe-Mn family superoxide dismutase
MRPNAGGGPQATLLQKIVASFGSLEACKKELAAPDVSRCGSGWARLMLEGGILTAIKTADANGPMTAGMKSLRIGDAWELVYYLDCQNRRVDYAHVVLDKMIIREIALQNAS